jgi:hypothetical protein
MKRMLGTKPLWLFETSCSGGQPGPGRSALLSGTQCAGADVDQGRRPNLSESRVDTRQSERHILVPADQTTSGPGIVQAIAACLIGVKDCGPMEMVIASSPVDVDRGQASQYLVE